MTTFKQSFSISTLQKFYVAKRHIKREKERLVSVKCTSFNFHDMICMLDFISKLVYYSFIKQKEISHHVTFASST